MSARSFVVRALLESEDSSGDTSWRGIVTDAATGRREVWRRPSEVARFISRQLASSAPVDHLAAEGVAAVSAPPLTDVVTDMINRLASRLPLPAPALPAPNVTLERVRERLVGLGNHRGGETVRTLGTRTLRGGRLDARVRFQLWGASSPGVDSAVLALQADLLDDRDQLREEGFLKVAGVDTTLAEHVETVNGWRKASSFDVLYEYQYVDSDDAKSLIVRIPVTTDPERADSPDREVDVIRDLVVRWDENTAEPLVVSGPVALHRLSLLVYEEGPPLSGTVSVRRSVEDSATPVVHHASLDTFLDAVTGDDPAETDADVTLAIGDLLTALGATGDALALGDLAADGTPDTYAGFSRSVTPPIVLPTSADRLTISYTPPPGPATGLDQTAVVYVRANAP